MTDRDLLTLAAKAAGLDYIRTAVWIEDGFYSPFPPHARLTWNPLHHTGDAFALAVQLGMRVAAPGPDEAHAAANNVFEPCGTGGLRDGFAATRRAIVRAAAALGEKMP